jgi:hypothetical protein
VRASTGQRPDGIAEHIKAIIFLGTPHRGSSFTLPGKLVAGLLRPLGSNPSILAEVDYDSAFLLDLHSHFVRVVHDDLRVVNFFEQRPTDVLRFWLLRWREFVGLMASAVKNTC